MKYTALNVVIAGLLLAGSAQAATVYEKEGNKLDISGFLKGMYYGSNNEGQQGDQSFARVNIKGWTQLTEDWTAFARLEKELSSNQNEHLRHSHIGVTSKEYGTLTYGRQYGLFYSQIASKTDVLVEFGNDGLGDGSDKFGTGRTSGLASYLYSNDGLSLGVQATLANSSDRDYGNGMKKESEEGYALSAGYEFSSGFGITAAYNEAGKTTNQISHANFGGNDRAKLAGVAVKYKSGDLYTAMTLSKGQDQVYINGGFAEENTGLEAVVQYQFTPEFRLGVAYVQGDVEEHRNGYDYDGTLTNYAAIEGKYNFKPNLHVFASYKINLLDEKDGVTFGQNTDDIVAVGVEYAF